MKIREIRDRDRSTDYTDLLRLVYGNVMFQILIGYDAEKIIRENQRNSWIKIPR